jgi:serine protease Do
MYDDNIYGSENIYSTQSPVENRTTVQEEKKKTEKKMGGFHKVMVSICLGLLFGVCAGLGFYAVAKTTGVLDAETAAMQSTVTNTTAANATIGTLSNDSNETTVTTLVTEVQSDITSVVEKMMPSMVSIVEYYTYTNDYYSMWGQNYSEEVSASGSGILIAETDDEYIIVTNNHVISDAERIEVTFVDDTTVEAHLKGTDPSKDLAIIAVQKTDVEDSTENAISIATLGDSDNLVLGESVIAIGNALGYGQSVTDGIVSALNREVTTEDGYTNTFIQTNAAINPGNSGGALINLNGEVIGINSNKIGGSAIEGMGYAIPISDVMDVINELMEQDTLIKVAEDEVGYIGISLQEITSSMAERFNIPVGIYIVETTDGGAAQAAGLVAGDIITGFNGRTVSSYSDLQNILQYYAAGTTVSITFERQENGKYVEHTVDLTLGYRPAQN